MNRIKGATDRRARNFVGRAARDRRAARFSTPRVNANALEMRFVFMRIAKAVVLAMDCRGPEPWPSLGLSTQHLAPVANKPVLFHHLEALALAGIEETAI